MLAEVKVEPADETVMGDFLAEELAHLGFETAFEPVGGPAG